MWMDAAINLVLLAIAAVFVGHAGLALWLAMKGPRHFRAYRCKRAAASTLVAAALLVIVWVT